MRYELVQQKPYCCGPACLQMILRSRGIEPASQEEIGWELGLTVPENEVHHFRKVRVGSPPTAGGYGTNIDKPGFTLNEYFLRHGINVQALELFPPDLEYARILIKDFLGCGADIMALVDVEKFYYRPGVRAGHFVLIEGLQISGEELVSVVDPNHDFRYQRPLKHVFESINVQRGVWRGRLYIVAEPELLG